MALGHKTGGRKAGTRNRQTREITELLESLGHNPIEAMVRIATDPNASLEPRGRMNAELAQYVYPKRKAVEVAADQHAPGPRKCLPTKRMEPTSQSVEGCQDTLAG
jgi:hypothetical protein